MSENIILEDDYMILVIGENDVFKEKDSPVHELEGKTVVELLESSKYLEVI